MYLCQIGIFILQPTLLILQATQNFEKKIESRNDSTTLKVFSTIPTHQLRKNACYCPTPSLHSLFSFCSAIHWCFGFQDVDIWDRLWGLSTNNSDSTRLITQRLKKNEKSFSFWPPGAKHCMLSKPIRNHGSIWRMGTGPQFFAFKAHPTWKHYRHGLQSSLGTILSRIAGWAGNLGWETWKFHFRNASLDSEIASLSKQTVLSMRACNLLAPNEWHAACIFTKKKKAKKWSSSPHPAKTSGPIRWVNVLLFGEGRQKCQAQSDETSHGLCQNKIPQKNRVENDYGPQNEWFQYLIYDQTCGLCWCR